MTSRVEDRLEVSRSAVWDVLSDGWLFTNWVVGASRIRDVDSNWPQVGSSLHHSVGIWPFVVDDATSVLSSEPLEVLELRARAWPFGAAIVEVRLSDAEPDAGSASACTDVIMSERVVDGPAVHVPDPLIRPMLDWRNRECLRRLGFLARGHAIRS